MKFTESGDDMHDVIQENYYGAFQKLTNEEQKEIEFVNHEFVWDCNEIIWESKEELTEKQKSILYKIKDALDGIIFGE